MNNWGWCINDMSLHDIISCSYQKRVPIKIPHVGQRVMGGTKKKNHRHRFHIRTGYPQTYLIKQHRTVNTYII